MAGPPKQQPPAAGGAAGAARACAAGGGLRAALHARVLAPLACSCFVGSIVLSALLCHAAVALIFLWPARAAGWTLLAALAALALAPIGEPPAWAAAAIAYSCGAAADYFQARVVFEDEGALRADKPYVIALEPHSALPTAVPVVFGTRSVLLPESLCGRTHGLVSSVCFKVPLVRQLYRWWGFRPITRASMRRLLARGRAVVLVPGGVQECLVMEHEGTEVAFLRKRKGFIRVAMQCGADVVPVFAFGQTQTYGWLRPGPPLVSEGAVKAMSRTIGMVPLLLLGRWGTPIPHPARLTVVVGAPLQLPQHDAPPEELVQGYLDKYISDLEALFERNKAAAGHKSLVLRVL
ncbi:MAG: diacylglycerol acyltransferase-domain-containing protein [Monoraphidium minutum]|nr:MAG: diacylglycerol acyltransferase-domain-containing protein [Monoraphidium minutum]